MFALTKSALFSFTKKSVSLITTTALVFGSFAFVAPQEASALTTTLYPTANGTYTAWTNDFDEVNETSNFSCGSNYILGSDINTRESYTVNLSGVPDGSTITSIDVRTYSSNHNVGNKNGEYRALVRLNGVDSLSTGSPVNPVDECAGYTETVNVTDTVKSNATTLEIGVEKQNASSAGSVRIGAIHTTITYTAPVVPDACGTVTTYEKTDDFSDSRVNINFESSDKQIDVSAATGYKVTEVSLDVENDGHSDYHLYASGPLDNFNPNPGDSIKKAKVKVVKNCATLTLVKTITNDNNGAAAATDWTLVASSTNTSTKISGVTAAPAVTAATVAVGTYNLSEINGPTGYTAGAWSCTDGTLVGSTLTLVAGDTATCTINNNDNVPPPVENTAPLCSDGQDNDSDTLTDLNDPDCAPFIPKVVVTKVISGGPEVLFNAFTFTVNGGAPVTFDVDGIVTVPTATGTLSVVEGFNTNYNASYSAGCSGTIAVGETKNCTITNTYIPPQPPSCDAILSSDTVVSNGGELVDGGPANAVETWEHSAWLDESGDGAKWIWSTPEVVNPSVDETHTFTETFNVVGTPTGGSISIAADNGYEVTLNGNPVCSSNTSDPHYAAYEVCPIPAGSFNSGSNTLAVKTTNLQYATQDPHTNPAGVIYKLTVNKNACIPAPTVAAVTMCKVDQNNAPLAGWTLTLKGAHVEDLSVASNLIAGINTVANMTTGMSYIATAVGTWLNQGGANPVDTEYSTTDGWTTQMDGYTGYQTDILELQINNTFDPNSNWGAYNSAHTYAQSFMGMGAPANFRIFDGTGTTQNEGWFGDNSGSLNVNVSKGYAGITGQNGCVTFQGVPMGTYTVGEVMQDGWTNISGLGQVVVDAATESFTVKNSNVKNFNIKVTKYSCAADTAVTREANGPDATGAHTAPQTCSLTENVKFGYFHYAAQTSGSAPYAYLENFAPTAQATNGSGVTTFTVPQEGRYDLAELDSTGDRVQDIHDLSDTGATNTVLGFYCNTDGGTSTDNLDYVIAGQIEDGQADCVVYNVEVPKQCNANATKQIVSSATTGNAVVLTFNHASWVDETLIDPLAKWVWSENGVNDPTVNETEVFTDTFTIVGTPLAAATLTFAADNQYSVKVNGNAVAGCANAGEFNYNVIATCSVPTSMLVNGANTIEFTVTNMALAGSTDETNPAGVVYELVYTENECEVPPPPTQCVANQELFVNGSFENPVVTNGAGWDIFASGTSWMAEWFGGSATFNSVNRPEIANIELQKDGLNGWTTPFGAQWTELDSDWNGHVGTLNNEPGAVTIGQTIATAVGKTYSVTYSFSPRPGTAASENVIEVLANGVVIDTVGPTAGGANTSWTNETASFVATSTSAVISFRDAGTPNNSVGSLLDNVSVMCVPVVPPPTDVCTNLEGNQSTIPQGYHAGEVANTCEIDTPAPQFVTVSIYKYIKSGESIAPATSGSFPMTANWNASNIGAGGPVDVTAGPSNFSITSTGYATSTSFAAETSQMSVPADYSVAEFTGEGSNVLPSNAQCVADKYRLVGYKVGDTLEAAKVASISTTYPTFVDITSSKYVIVVNELCGNGGGDPEPTTGTLVIVKNTTTGNGSFTINVDEVCNYYEYSILQDFNPCAESFSEDYVLTTVDKTATESVELQPGTYNVTENVPEGWDLDGVSCEYDGESEGYVIANGKTIYIEAGDTVTCTFVNEQEESDVTPTTTQCNDSTDNDGDGLNNYPADPGCSSSEDNDETNSGGGGSNGPISGTSFGGPVGQVAGASTSLPELPAGCDALIHTYMRKGKKNDAAEVKLLQTFLNTHMNAGLPVSGVFGSMTDKAVRAFQQKYAEQVLTPWGLNAPTGFVYRTTQRWVNLMHCKDLNIPMPELIPFSQQ